MNVKMSVAALAIATATAGVSTAFAGETDSRREIAATVKHWLGQRAQLIWPHASVRYKMVGYSYAGLTDEVIGVTTYVFELRASEGERLKVLEGSADLGVVPLQLETRPRGADEAVPFPIERLDVLLSPNKLNVRPAEPPNNDIRSQVVLTEWALGVIFAMAKDVRPKGNSLVGNLDSPSPNVLFPSVRIESTSSPDLVVLSTQDNEDAVGTVTIDEDGLPELKPPRYTGELTYYRANGWLRAADLTLRQKIGAEGAGYRLLITHVTNKEEDE